MLLEWEKRIKPPDDHSMRPAEGKGNFLGWRMAGYWAVQTERYPSESGGAAQISPSV